MKAFNKKTMTGILSLMLILSTLLFSDVVINVDASKTLTTTTEEYNAATWNQSSLIYEKSANIKQGGLGTLGVYGISPSDINEATIVYRFEAESGKAFSAVNVVFRGKATVGSYIKLYASCDNSQYTPITTIASVVAGDPYTSLATNATDLAAVAYGKKAVYLKIVMKSAENATDACLDYLRVYCEEIPDTAIFSAKDNGEIISESFNNALEYLDSSNLLSSYNLQQGTVNSGGGQGCVYVSDNSNYGYLLYKIATKAEMRSININYTGRTTTSSATQPTAYFGYSRIEVLIFTADGWQTVVEDKGYGTSGNNADIVLPKGTVLIDNVYGTKDIYLMARLRTVTTSGTESNAALNSLTITTEGKKNVAPVNNGQVLNQSYNSDSYAQNALLIDYRNVKLGKSGGADVLTLADTAKSKIGYLLYEIKTARPMATMVAYLKGIAAAGSTNASIKVSVSSEETGTYKQLSGVAAENGQTLDFLASETPVIISGEIYDTSEVYLKIELLTEDNTAFAGLSSLRVETTKLGVVPVVSNGLLLDEQFNADSYSVNDNLLAANNTKIDVLDSNTTDVKVIRPKAPGSAAELLYQVKTDLPMFTLSAMITGRVISTTAGNFSSIEVLVSDNGADFTSAELIKNDSLEAEYTFLSSPRSIHLDSYAKGKTSLYVKLIIISAGTNEGTATWGSVNSFQLVSTKQTNIPVTPNGIIINEGFDSQYWNTANNNVLNIDNLIAGNSFDPNYPGIKVITTGDKSKSGSMIFQVKTDKPIGTMLLEYKGRVISTDSAKTSYISYSVSEDGVNWRSVGQDQGNTLDSTNSFILHTQSPRIKNISDEAYGKISIYLKVELFSVNDTWGCLDYLKVITSVQGENSIIPFIPEPTANGVVLNQDFTAGDNFVDRAYSYDSVQITPTSNTDAKKALVPMSGSAAPATGFVTYAISTSAPIGPASVQFTGRAIRGSALEFLLSADGVNWKSVYYITSPIDGDNLDYYGELSMSRGFDITNYVKNTQFFYLRIRLDSYLESWGCIRTLKVVTQNVPTAIPASKAVPNGVLLDNDFEGEANNWDKQALELSNMKRDILDSNKPENTSKFIYPVDISKPCYIIYGYRTTAPMGELTVDFTGRSIYGSAIKIYASKDRMSWELAAEYLGPKGAGTQPYSDITKSYTASLTEYIKGSNIAYVKIELQSGFESWASLGSIKITSMQGSSGSSTGGKVVDDGLSYYDPNYEYNTNDNDSSELSSSSDSQNISKTPIKGGSGNKANKLFIIIGAVFMLVAAATCTLIILARKNMIFKKKEE